MAIQSARGMCCEEEDCLKWFVPTLFDSDSDAEDTFPASENDIGVVPCLPSLAKPLHVHLGKPLKKTTSSEAFSKVQSYNKRPLTPDMDFCIKEDQPEASSPSSQGNSNASTQTPFSGPLDSSDSLDSASPFCSVLSFASTDTVFDFDTASFIDGPAAKRPKVESGPILRGSPVSASSPVNTSLGLGLRPEVSIVCNLPAAHSMPTPSRPSPPGLLPRHSLPPFSPLGFNTGGVTTGIPVDSSPAELSRPWSSPQTMIPTNPPNSFYSGHYGSHIPANLPAPVTSYEKIAAALLEVKKAPLMASPLGLKLDKSRVASGLQALGMVLRE